MENRCHFSKGTTDCPNLLWVVGHFISVTYCMIDLTNFSSSLVTNSTFLIAFSFYFNQGHPIKFALSLPVLENFTAFTLFPHLAYNS